MKKTKIVSTLGPSSTDVDTIVKLIEAGANVFRFNFSHGDHEEHLGRMQAVAEAEKITGKTVGRLLDTKGAEIRTTKQADGRFNSQLAMYSVSQWTTASKEQRKRLQLLILDCLTTLRLADKCSLMMVC